MKIPPPIVGLRAPAKMESRHATARHRSQRVAAAALATMILVIGAVSAEAASIAPGVEAAAAIGNRTAVNPPGVDLSLVGRNVAIKITTGAVAAGAAPEVEAAVAIGRRTIVNPSRLDLSLVGHNATSPI